MDDDDVQGGTERRTGISFLSHRKIQHKECSIANLDQYKSLLSTEMQTPSIHGDDRSPYRSSPEDVVNSDTIGIDGTGALEEYLAGNRGK